MIFDAEHFFDGYNSDSSYALKALHAAVSGGAYCLCLCDTNGGTLPQEIHDITKKVCSEFGDIIIGIHAIMTLRHGNSRILLVFQAGASQVQGTFLGFGERCGNANLSSIIPNLQIKLGYSCIPRKAFGGLPPRLKISETAKCYPA